MFVSDAQLILPYHYIQDLYQIHRRKTTKRGKFCIAGTLEDGADPTGDVGNIFRKILEKVGMILTNLLLFMKIIGSFFIFFSLRECLYGLGQKNVTRLNSKSTRVKI